MPVSASSTVPAVAAIALVLGLGLAPAAAEDTASTHYVSSSMSFEAETGYRQTTGVRGALFGHVSAADLDGVVRQGQARLIADLAREGIDAARVTILPVTVTDARTRVVSKGSATRERFFGGTKTDDFAKFALEGTMTLAFLVEGDAPVPDGYRRQRVTGAKVRLGVDRSAGGRRLAEVDVGSPAALHLGAFTAATSVNAAPLRLQAAVPARVRYALGDALAAAPGAAAAAERAELEVAVALELADGRAVTLEVGDDLLGRDEILRALGKKGVGRLLSPSFGLHRARTAIDRVKARRASRAPAARR